jgi:hypothetical protein
MIVTVAVTDLTTRQTKRLAEFLANLNIQRVQQGKAPFSTYNDYCVDYLTQWTTDHVRNFDVVEGELVKEAYINASNANQTSVKTTLGLP